MCRWRAGGERGGAPVIATLELDRRLERAAQAISYLAINVLLALALPAAVLVVATFDALHVVLCTIGRALLAPRTPASGPVREMLAESLGDRSVNIAYWLPDREVFVDESGRPVELPAPGSGRAWTAVERDGRRVAAIVHDAALDTSPELVQAAAAAS